jgi:hypothetical protein
VLLKNVYYFHVLTTSSICVRAHTRHRYFTGNTLVRTKSFLDEITLKSPAEKIALAAELRTALRRMRPAAVVRHLVRPLLSRVMLAEPALADVVQDLLQPLDGEGGVLPEAEYRAAVVPRLLELCVHSLTFAVACVSGYFVQARVAR